MSESTSAIEKARRDPAEFARLLVGQPLWPHQLEVVRSAARYRVICAGRRSGKTRVFGVLALHTAFSKAWSRVLIVSAGEVASKRMFAEIAAMARSSPYLAGSVADETKSLLVLSNGSQIECVPASMAQVRSAEADLLIVDEAGFVANEIWEAAEPVVIARPGSRVLLCSSPWGSAEHYFRQLWSAGMVSPGEQLESWHWPSSHSPLVDEALLAQIEERSNPVYFRREYLAEWMDGAGTYFSPAELDEAPVCELVPPGEAIVVPATGGVDWGWAHDASTLVVVAGAGESGGRPRYRVAWLEERFATSYAAFINVVVASAADASYGRGYAFVRVVSEANGVGAMPSQELQTRFGEASRWTVVAPVYTTLRLKEDGFGFVKLLLQQQRLELPRHPGLLKQLASLEYSMTDGGSMRISVPETRGHDDLAMALCLAVTPLMADDAGWLGGALAPPQPPPRVPLSERGIDFMTVPM